MKVHRKHFYELPSGDSLSTACGTSFTPFSTAPTSTWEHFKTGFKVYVAGGSESATHLFTFLHCKVAFIVSLAAMMRMYLNVLWGGVFPVLFFCLVEQQKSLSQSFFSCKHGFITPPFLPPEIKCRCEYALRQLARQGNTVQTIVQQRCGRAKWDIWFITPALFFAGFFRISQPICFAWLKLLTMEPFPFCDKCRNRANPSLKSGSRKYQYQE